MHENFPKRGDIYWADFPKTEGLGSEQVGRRPVVIVSTNLINSTSPIVVIVPLSARVSKANRQHRILIPENEKISEPDTEGCGGESLALTEQVRVLSRERLYGKRVARLTPKGLSAVRSG